jgi:two-component sensor histidine kinase
MRTRLLSVAAVQKHLQASGIGEPMAVAPYLTKLCDSLSQSMISGSRPISLEVVAGEGSLSTNHAVSIGLVVTEGVLNAIKHAFPADRSSADCRIVVKYEVDGPNWMLSIADNGVGKPEPGGVFQLKHGLGTSIVQALAQQLAANVEVTTGESGTTLALVHRGSNTAIPQAA